MAGAGGGRTTTAITATLRVIMAAGVTAAGVIAGKQLAQNWAAPATGPLFVVLKRCTPIVSPPGAINCFAGISTICRLPHRVPLPTAPVQNYLTIRQVKFP